MPGLTQQAYSAFVFRCFFSIIFGFYIFGLRLTTFSRHNFYLIWVIVQCSICVMNNLIKNILPSASSIFRFICVTLCDDCVRTCHPFNIIICGNPWHCPVTNKTVNQEISNTIIYIYSYRATKHHRHTIYPVTSLSEQYSTRLHRRVHRYLQLGHQHIFGYCSHWLCDESFDHDNQNHVYQRIPFVRCIVTPTVICPY